MTYTHEAITSLGFLAYTQITQSHADIKSKDVLISAGKIMCILCNREIEMYKLSSHIKLDPQQDKWLVGCDRANEKQEEERRAKKRSRNEENGKEIETQTSRKVSKTK